MKCFIVYIPKKEIERAKSVSEMTDYDDDMFLKRVIETMSQQVPRSKEHEGVDVIEVSKFAADLAKSVEAREKEW